MKAYTAILVLVTSLMISSCVSVSVIEMPVLTPPTGNLVLKSHKINLASCTVR